MFIFVLVINISLILITPTKTTTIAINDSFQSAHGTNITLITQEPTNGIAVNFTIRFTNCLTNCTPVVYFFRSSSIKSGMNTKRSCFNIPGSLSFNEYYYSVTESREDSCHASNNNKDLICSSSRRFYLEEKKFWFVQIGFNCGDLRKLEVEYNFSIMPDIVPECKQFNHDKCGNKGKYVAFPNIFGIDTIDAALVAIRNFDLFPSIQGQNPCYKHIYSFSCLSMFPLCDPNTVNHENIFSELSGNSTLVVDDQRSMTSNSIPKVELYGKYFIPCKQMCYDLLSGCSTEQEENQFIIVSDCEIYPDANSPGVNCEYKPVTCVNPPIFPNTTVENRNTSNLNDTVQYECDDGMDRDKSALISRCLPTGNWSKIGRPCQDSKPPKRGKFDYVPLVVVAILFVMIGISCLIIRLHRNAVRLVLRHFHIWLRNRCGCPPLSGDADITKVFLSFSSEDMEKAHTFKEDVKNRFPQCQIITYHEDFTAGSHIVEQIAESVMTSRAFIVFLSQNYINSVWCNHEFGQADQRLKRESEFRLVVVLAEDINDTNRLTNIQEPLTTYITTHLYLWIHKRDFWVQIRRALLE